MKEFSNTISITSTDARYPTFPYTDNRLKDALLETLVGLGLSRENPFAGYVSPGQTVLIKPNWVRDKNPLGHDIESLVTHSSLIAPVIDFLALAMQGKGTIIVADAPLQNCNFDHLKQLMHIEEIAASVRTTYPELSIIVEDWRITTLKSSSSSAEKIQNIRLADDEAVKKEFKVVDLGTESFLEEISAYADRFRVTKYKPSLMRDHHHMGTHEYLITRRVFEADFIVNMPKIKTHIKAGMTGALKNLIGINGHKEFLPHHIKGSYFEGGDNYCMPNWWRRKYEDLYDYVWEHANDMAPRKRKVLMKILDLLLRVSFLYGSEKITAGSWRGNDTIWRTTLDLNHIAYFKNAKQPKILTIADAVIAGEGEGPLEPTPYPLGMIIAGEHPVLVDAAAAYMMGYTLAHIPTIDRALHHRHSQFATTLTEATVHFHDGVAREIAFADLPKRECSKPTYWQGA